MSEDIWETIQLFLIFAMEALKAALGRGVQHPISFGVHPVSKQKLNSCEEATS
jgi:hypothetical protein